MAVPDSFGFRTVTEHYGHLTIYQSHCGCFRLQAGGEYPIPLQLQQFFTPTRFRPCIPRQSCQSGILVGASRHPSTTPQ